MGHEESTSLRAQEAYEGLVIQLGCTSGSEMGLYMRANTARAQAGGTDRGLRRDPALPASRTKSRAWYSHSRWTPECWDFPQLWQSLYSLPCPDSLPYISGLSNLSASFGGLISLIAVAFITQQ